MNFGQTDRVMQRRCQGNVPSHSQAREPGGTGSIENSPRGSNRLADF